MMRMLWGVYPSQKKVCEIVSFPIATLRTVEILADFAWSGNGVRQARNGEQ
jgi:hypothetical protein